LKIVNLFLSTYVCDAFTSVHIRERDGKCDRGFKDSFSSLYSSVFDRCFRQNISHVSNSYMIEIPQHVLFFASGRSKKYVLLHYLLCRGKKWKQYCSPRRVIRLFVASSRKRSIRIAALLKKYRPSRRVLT
jgi:hypothetical protein